MNIANIITSVRIILIPIMALLFFLHSDGPKYYVTFVFIIAAISDYLDGYLARKMNQVSKLGKFLDPVADKLLVITSLKLILGVLLFTDLDILKRITI